jgi:hypothetical protein
MQKAVVLLTKVALVVVMRILVLVVLVAIHLQKAVRRGHLMIMKEVAEVLLLQKAHQVKHQQSIISVRQDKV